MSVFLGKTTDNTYGISQASFDDFVNTSITTGALSASSLAVSGASALHAVSVTDITFPATNISLGGSSGDLITSGLRNIALGQYAGQKVSSGSDNCAIGDHSQTELQTNNGNTSVGSNTLMNNLGSSNAVFGYNSCGSNVTGSNNVVVGASSAGGASNLNRVVVLGSSSLTTATDVTNCIVIGSQNDPAGLASNACFIGNTNVTKTVLQGAVSTTGSVSVPTTADLLFSGDESTLASVLSDKVDTGDFTTALALKTDKPTTTNTVFGNGAAASLTTGQYNLALGPGALATNASNNGNVAIGASAAAASIGNSNTVLGYLALTNNSGGSNSVVVGASSASGAGNLNRVVVLGSSSLTTATDVSNCVVIGCQNDPADLASNAVFLGNTNVTKTVLQGAVSTTGSVSVPTTADLLFSGDTSTLASVLSGKVDSGDLTTALALKTDKPTTTNTVFGLGAAAALTSGTNNVAVGPGALATCATNGGNIAIGASAAAATIGDSNVCVGHLSLGSNSAGSKNVILGSNCATLSTNLNRTIVIGERSLNASTNQVTNTIVIGSLNNPTDPQSNTVYLGNDAIVSTILKGDVQCSGGITLPDYTDLFFTDQGGSLSTVLNTKASTTDLSDAVLPLVPLTLLTEPVGAGIDLMCASINTIDPADWLTSSALSSALGALAVADIDGLTAALGDKADDADLTTLSGTVSTLSSTVAGKADSSDVCLLTGAQTVAGAKVFSSPVTTQSVYELFHSITSGTNAFTLDVSVGNVFYLSTGTTTSANFSVQLNNCPTASTQSMNVTLIYATTGKWFCNSISCYSDAGSTAITLASSTPLYNGGTPAPTTSTVLAQTFCLVRLFASNYVLSSLSSFY